MASDFERNDKFMKKTIYFLVILMLSAGVSNTVFAETVKTTEFYVSVNGSDNNNGTKDSPFATIERAQEAVRLVNKDMQSDITVYLREGVYCSDKTLVFEPEDSGTNGYYVKYCAYEDEKVKISGGKRVTGWEKYNDKIWKTTYGDGGYVRQLYVNDRRAKRAQSEKMEFVSALYDDKSDETFENDGLIIQDKRFAEYKNQGDIQLHFTRGWNSYLFNVNEIQKNDKDESIFLMRTQVFNKSVKDANHPVKAETAVMVENAFEELDTEGEFYYDRPEKTLYYMPRADEDLNTADIWAANLEEILKVKGEGSSNKVRNIEFSGIEFAHGAWERPARSGLKSGQAQTFSVEDGDEKNDAQAGFVPACIQFTWAEKISFVNNTVKDMGAVGLGLYQGVKYCNIEGNTFADTADSAITVGLPNQTYEDEVYEGYNLAADKPATSNGDAAGYPASAAVDVNNRSIWAQGGKSPAWVQIDLLQPYRIDRIEVVARQDMDQITTRSNFEIQASNDPEFGKYVVLARQGSTPFEHKGTCVLYSDDDGEYRYVRIKKTDSQYFLIAEMRIINEDMEYSAMRESCKYNRIRNNYITRAGYTDWGAPGIQAYYVQDLDISHNEIYNVAYTGIAIGWGWTSYPDSKVCRDNKVMFNRVHFNNMINFDGGSFYSLGQMPNTIIKGNYMSDQPNYIAGLYSDNGTKYHMITENVVENVNQSYFINSGTGYITYKDNYSPHNGAVMANDHTSAESVIRYIPGNPPIEALRIMRNSGIEKEWRYIKERAGENMWPVGNDLKYADIRYDAIDDNKFMNNYLKNFITNAEIWIEMAEIGTEPGTYKAEAVDEFKEFLKQAKEITAKTPIDRDEILKTRLEYEAALEKFKAGKNTLSKEDMIAWAEKTLNDTPVGIKIGNVSQEEHDALKQMIEETKTSDDELTSQMLERSVVDFNKEKINLDITEFVLDEQLEDAQIDNQAKTITVKVKHYADMSRVKPAKIKINDQVNISPAASDTINLEAGATYTVSTKDGSESCNYKVIVKKPDVINSDENYSLKDIIADEDNWTVINANDQRYYKNVVFGDITLEFNAQIEAVAGNWPSIVFRSQSPSEGFDSKTNDCYVMVLNPGKIELHRFNKGVRTQFFGDVDGVEQKFGSTIASDAFKFGAKNKVLITCKNVDNGVNIIVNINGTEVINIIDNYPGAITEAGYFGKIQPKSAVELSAE